MQKFNFLDDLTSDVMFEAFGRTLEELFVHAAEALFSVVCDINRVQELKTIPLTIEAHDEEALLFKWLSTLLTESEIHGLFLSAFRITALDKGTVLKLQAVAAGEPVSQEKGDTVVKGITYYGFKLEKHGDFYRAQVAMDI